MSPEQRKTLRVLYEAAVNLSRELAGEPLERRANGIAQGLKKLLEGTKQA